MTTPEELFKAAAKAEKANANLNKLLGTFGRANAILGGISLGIDLYKGLKKLTDEYFFSLDGEVRFYESEIAKLDAEINSSNRKLLGKRNRGSQAGKLSERENERAEKIRTKKEVEKQAFIEMKEAALALKQKENELLKAQEFGLGKLVISNDEILKLTGSNNVALQIIASGIHKEKPVEETSLKPSSQNDIAVTQFKVTNSLSTASNHLEINAKLLNDLLLEFKDIESLCSCDKQASETIKESIAPQKECECPTSSSIPSTTDGSISETPTDPVEKAEEKLNTFGNLVKEIFGDIKTLSDGWIDGFIDKVIFGKESVKGFFKGIVDQLKDTALNNLKDTAKDLLKKIFSPEGGLGGEDGLFGGIKGIFNKLFGGSDGSAGLFSGLIGGIKNIFGSIFNGPGNILSSLIGSSGGGGIFSKVLGFLPSLFGFGGFFASGGPVSGGVPYVVGERGPELFMPSSNGKIIPNHRLNGLGAGGNAISVNATVNINGGNVGPNGADPKTALAVQRQFENMAKQAFQAQLRQEMRPGGMLTAGV